MALGKTSQSSGKARKAFHISQSWLKRGLLHLCILLGAVSIVIEKVPELFRIGEPSPVIVQTPSSDELLAEAIESSQKKPSPLIRSVKKQSIAEKESKQEVVVQSFDDLFKLDLNERALQLVRSFSADKLALWSVFGNLSTYTGMVDILKSPIKAFERETLRSESFGITAGFDQIIYRIHLENGGTSVVVSEVNEDSVEVSLYEAPQNQTQSYRVHHFRDGLWVESKDLLRAQVEESVLDAKKGSAVVLSASVGL